MSNSNVIPSEEADIQEYFNETEGNVCANGDVPGSYKQQENSKQKLTKHQAILKLKQFNYKTPAIEIESCLNIIFEYWEVKPDYWLFIAQHYTPKTINSIIAQMTKQHQRRDISIKNPGAYFSSIIKHRPKRRIFRRIKNRS